MKKLITVLAITFLLMSTVGLALELDASSLSGVKDSYNTDVDSGGVSSAIKIMIGDERLNLRIKNKDGSTTIVGIVGNGGKISQITSTSLEDPTIEFDVDEDAVESIAKSKNVFKGISEALGNGTIKYNTLTLEAAVKMFFSNVAIWFASLFDAGPSGNFLYGTVL